MFQNVLKKTQRYSSLFDSTPLTRQLRSAGIFSVLSTQSKEDRCGLLRPDLICAARPPSPIDKELVHSALEQLSTQLSAPNEGRSGASERIEIWQSLDQRWLLGHAGIAAADRFGHHQPFHSQDRSISLVIDGELLVDTPLIAHLAALGHPYSSQSSAQLLALLYQLHSTQMFSHLRGEFSFVLFDHQRQKLLAARDPLGAKPLYYVFHEDQLVVASEMKAMWAYGLPMSWNPSLLASTAQSNHRYDTLFDQIYQFPAGHYGRLDQSTDNSFRFESYSPPIKTRSSPPHHQHHHPQDRMIQLIQESLNLHCATDATIGCFVSNHPNCVWLLQHLRDIPLGRRRFLGSTASIDQFHSFPDLPNFPLPSGFEISHLNLSPAQLIESFERVVHSVESPLLDFSPAIQRILANELHRHGATHMLSFSSSSPFSSHSSPALEDIHPLPSFSTFFMTDQQHDQQQNQQQQHQLSNQESISVLEYLISMFGHDRSEFSRPLFSLTPFQAPDLPPLDTQVSSSNISAPSNLSLFSHPILETYLQDSLRSSKNHFVVPFIDWSHVIRWLDSSSLLDHQSQQMNNSIKVILTSLVLLGKKFIDNY